MKCRYCPPISSKWLHLQTLLHHFSCTPDPCLDPTICTQERAAYLSQKTGTSYRRCDPRCRRNDISRAIAGNPNTSRILAPFPKGISRAFETWYSVVGSDLLFVFLDSVAIDNVRSGATLHGVSGQRTDSTKARRNRTQCRSFVDSSEIGGLQHKRETKVQLVHT